MELVQAVQKVFGQLAASLCQLRPEEYAQPSQALSGHTIGQHVRHIIEGFQCLDNGYEQGLINYEKRKRDQAIENDPVLACRLLDEILTGLSRPDRPLVLEASYNEGSPRPLALSTNFYREIAYNLEHTIHHMALIRIGIRDNGNDLALPEGYGIASSTLQYRRECAQ
ncbi:MAG: DinB family protein [Bacteroidota bacterium]